MPDDAMKADIPAPVVHETEHVETKPEESQSKPLEPTRVVTEAQKKLV